MESGVLVAHHSQLLGRHGLFDYLEDLDHNFVKLQHERIIRTEVDIITESMLVLDSANDVNFIWGHFELDEGGKAIFVLSPCKSEILPLAEELKVFELGLNIRRQML